MPALAREDVEHRLRADDLRERRDQRREADLGAHDRDLLQHLGQPIERPLVGQLTLQIADHAAGHLVRVHLHVGQRGDPAVEPLLDAHPLEVLGDGEELLQVELRVVGGADESRHDHLGGRLGVAEGQGHGRGVDHVHAGLDGLEVGHRRKPTDVVAVQLERQVDLGLEASDELFGVER